MIYKLKAPAKINISLDVIGKRADGYHNLETIMHTVPLYDLLEFCENNSQSLRIFSDNPTLCTDERNIVFKAYKAFYKKTALNPLGFDVKITKNIPDSAGLAGGSSDGAETLKFLNRFHDYPLTEKELIDLSSTVGADLPFLIKGGCCLCEGIGDILTPLPELKNIKIVIAKPETKGLSTPEIFGALKLDKIEKRPETKKIISSLNNNLEEIFPYMYNVLEEVSITKCPEIKTIEDIMISNGAEVSIMSGSGNSVFGIFLKDTSAAVNALKTSGLQLFIADLSL